MTRGPVEVEAAAAVKRLAAEAGFALCGVAEARPSDHGRAFGDWLAQGKQGEMAWLAEHVQTRLDPRELLHGARSVICVADRLPPPERAPEVDVAAEQGEGRVARYAQISDYHKTIKKRLFALADALRGRWPDEQYRVCVDTAPIMEREHAQRAGLGWRGKHTLLLNRDVGSHLLLGEIVTTLAVAPDGAETDHCGSCTRCVEACPTDAITPYSVDARRCISYLTIEHRSSIDPAYHEAMGDWLFGCDICQDVCPFVQRAEGRGDGAGQSAPDAPTLPPGYERRAGAFDLAAVLDWDEEARREAFVKSAMKRAKLAMMKRNALIVAGNRLRRVADAALRGRIEAMACDASEEAMVRETARAVLAGVGARGEGR